LTRSSRTRRQRIASTRVWLNGQEVTARCFYADPRRGLVRLFLHNAEGRPFLNRETMEAAKEERRGRVKVRVSR
jgi:hypothetical protein